MNAIDTIAKEAHISKAAAEKALDAFLKLDIEDIDEWLENVDLGKGKIEADKIIQFVNWLAAELDEIHKDINDILTESNKHWAEIEKIKEDIKKYEPH